MSDFFNPSFWTFYISLGSLGGIAWLIYLLVSSSKTKAPPEGEKVKSTGHSWDAIINENKVYKCQLPIWAQQTVLRK